MTAIPVRAGTLAESRTQVVLKCDDCRHEWSIEVTPPVLIVKPDRQTDCATSCSRPQNAPEGHGAGHFSELNPTNDRRNLNGMHMRRMRVGLCGLLRSYDGTHTVAVLYSLDAQRAAGRLRPLNPGNLFPPWLHPDSRLRLSGYDGVPLYIRTTVVKLPREGRSNDDRFAEFVVRQATQQTYVG